MLQSWPVRPSRNSVAGRGKASALETSARTSSLDIARRTCETGGLSTREVVMPLVKMPEGYRQFQTCREPIKLSRERWNALWRAFRGPYPQYDAGSICVSVPHEAEGVTFLPATYVPRDA